MSNVAHLPAPVPQSFAFDKGALALIKRTVAADTTDDEFNLFVSYCQSLKLDPRRKQIYALVYNKDKPSKRRMSIIVAIDGFRSIAARSGCYRPDEGEPVYEFDEQAKSDENPLGLVKATVKVWQFAHGSWHPATAVAYWDEYAPIEDEKKWDDGARSYVKTGKRAPAGKWASMPRLMLAKVAEALALRKAWPDDFSGVYAEEEMDKARIIDMTPSEAVQEAEIEDRQARIGKGRAVLIDWLDNKPLENVPVGKLADRIADFIERNVEEPSQIAMFESRNRHGLREFWALSPTDSLAIKKKIEEALGRSG